jgi:hypothetical protein
MAIHTGIHLRRSTTVRTSERVFLLAVRDKGKRG